MNIPPNHIMPSSNRSPSALAEIATRPPIKQTIEWPKLRPEDAFVPAISYRVDGSIDTTHASRPKPALNTPSGSQLTFPSQEEAAPKWQWPLGSVLLSQIMARRQGAND
ncbi:hypothetical protein DJ018_16635 [Phenylobacterium deserti]|uniref:Uncharacterized protein n=1 Tax=Phenylobacterium deserti TaxID=1914756 RepID=A0A328ADR7_9CAUL|nr:hypothetical protein DJ018_16635 [Phenylobacterium deserti]